MEEMASGTYMQVTIEHSSRGFVLVALARGAVTAVLMGDDPAALRDDLQRRFPTVTLAETDPSVQPLVRRILAQVESPSASADVPLDLRGTAFQRAVWEALRAIPSGSTATYADIAARISRPESARAVARACASNVHAVVVPCHRVVRSDGALSGYRWGVERKRALLEAERGAAMNTAPADEH